MINDVYELGKEVLNGRTVKVEQMSSDVKERVLHMLHSSGDVWDGDKLSDELTLGETTSLDIMVDTDYFTGLCTTKAEYDGLAVNLDIVDVKEFYTSGFDLDNEDDYEAAIDEFCNELEADREVLVGVLNETVKEKERER